MLVNKICVQIYGFSMNYPNFLPFCYLQDDYYLILSLLLNKYTTKYEKIFYFLINGKKINAFYLEIKNLFTIFANEINSLLTNNLKKILGGHNYEDSEDV